MNTFDDGAVEKALAFAKRALELRPTESQASAQVARIYIIKKEYQTAWTLLNTAYDNDATNYYPWYLRGVIAVKMNDPKRALVQFDEAEKLAKHKYQHRQLNYQRQYIAKMNGDAAAEEALLKKNIQDNPDRANIYGNYAQFLKKHKRYDEAIAYWEKAIAISPYPHAIEQLKKTRELKQGQ
jgi:tetratricopeptide (TPR) repeat protein